MVRICTSMMRDPGDWVQARSTTPATSSGLFGFNQAIDLQSDWISG